MGSSIFGSNTKSTNQQMRAATTKSEATKTIEAARNKMPVEQKKEPVKVKATKTEPKKDSIEISTAARVRQLRQEGLSVYEVSVSLGLDVETVSSLLDIT